MKNLLNHLKTTIETLTAGEFFATESGGLREITVYTPELPPPESDDYTDEPCCEIVPMSRSLKPQPGYIIKIFFLLHNEDRQGALDDLDRLQTLLEPLATAGFPGYLLKELETTWGDPTTGVQNHPEYLLSLSLRYSGQPQRTIC